MSSSGSDSAVDLRATLALEAAGAAPDSSTEDVVLALFDQCGGRLVRYVESFGLQPDAAEDVVQDVFLALFRHLDRGRSRRNLRGWMFRVAHNLALKHRRRASSRDAVAAAGGIAWRRDADADADPEAQLADRQRSQRLQGAFAALPERDRRCLLLRAEGLTYREIALVLGVSLGTVAGTLARALSRLEVEHDR